MTKKILLAVLVTILIPASLALAGMDYPMKCTNCGYNTRVQVGGTMMFNKMTFFCVDSMKFVYLSWKRGEKKPEPMATVWDSATGKKIEVYKCPDCSKPVIPLHTQAEGDLGGPGFHHCPKCGSKTFKVEKEKGIIAVD